LTQETTNTTNHTTVVWQMGHHMTIADNTTSTLLAMDRATAIGHATAAPSTNHNRRFAARNNQLRHHSVASVPKPLPAAPTNTSLRWASL
jgi:hypothetical protein